MKWSRASILIHPLFISSLLLLICNDCYWKYEYHNFLTGKLSDVMGLLAVGLFLTAFIDNKKLVILFCSLLFAWWKSPLSQTFLDLLHSVNIDWQRTVDYTDLFALAVLPCIYYVRPPNYKLSYQKLAVSMSAILSLFAFCNTSAPYRHLYAYRDNEVRFNEGFLTARSEEEILRRLSSMSMTYHEDSVRYYPVKTQDVYFRIEGFDTARFVPVNIRDSALFEKQTANFYLIPFYVINKDTLKDIEVSFHPSGRGKPLSVFVESFRSENPAKYYNVTERKKLKKHFKRLFK